MKGIILSTKTIPEGISKKTGKHYNAFTLHKILIHTVSGGYDVIEKSAPFDYSEGAAALPAYVEITYDMRGNIDNCTILKSGDSAMLDFITDITG